MLKKKIPERKCLGCGQSLPKSTLLRVVKSPEGAISLDFTGKKNGRGAYICRRVSCFKKARKGKRFERNLECAIPEDVYDQLEKELEEGETDDGKGG